MVFLRLFTYFILFLFCSDTFCTRVTETSLTGKPNYRTQIITGEFNYTSIAGQDIFGAIIKGTAGEDTAGEGTAGEDTAGEDTAGEDTAGEGPFIKYISEIKEIETLDIKLIHVVYRHAQTPKSDYINPSHSVTEITQEGHIYSKSLGIVFSLLAKNNRVFFLTGDTKRNVKTQECVVNGYATALDKKIDEILSLTHSGINELKLGKYARMNKGEVLNDREFLETISSLGLLSGAEKSVAQSFVEFCSAISECELNGNKGEKSIKFVCSNSALMAAMERFSRGFKTINIPDNLAFFVLVPDYKKNIIYMCSPKLAAEILPGLKSEVDGDFANRFQECVAKLLCIEKDAELVKKIYEEMFTQNGRKIFNLDGNYITFGKKLSEDTLKEIEVKNQ